MLTNTATRYGAIARFFHWTIALLILTDIALGLIGEATPRNAETAAGLQTLYSVHKTIGVSVLLLAILRVLWAFTQPKPVPVHTDRKAELHLAEFIHWALYGAIFVMPISGWVMHSAETGFAPILWPFGQNLPFVPKSEDVAHVAGSVHGLAAWVLYISVALHISGALKHAVIDRDGVLARMLFGADAGTPDAMHRSPLVLPVASLVLWVGIVATPFAMPGPDHPAPEGDSAAPQETTTEEASLSPEQATDLPLWTVEEGQLGLTVTQMGAPVAGAFDRWTANIAYDPEAGTGEVTVLIDTTSLALGSVTDQAKGPEFFNVESYSTATFSGEIAQLEGTSHEAVGTLTLVGQTVPVTLAFDLTVEGDTATMSGSTTLDRRDFGMGAGYEDESTVGYTVEVATELTATRSE